MKRRTFIQLSFGSLGLTAAACTGFNDKCDSEECLEYYQFAINPELCTGCETCLDQCGKTAIEHPGEPNSVHINQDKCLHCSKCLFACEYDAVLQTPNTEAGPDFNYSINNNNCVVCLECFKTCDDHTSGVNLPVAIQQSNPVTTRINQVKCSHCGECVELAFCPFGAIIENNSPHHNEK
ncbi:MAG: hypothetical protein PF689_01835 [Deltaproteobacteria bacterium]|nr:hypothetical protein [Deltaproteobacteria bacterium]